MSRNQRRNRRNTSGGSQAARNAAREDATSRDAAPVRRSSTETKSSLKTTELIAYAATVLAIVMTALAVDADSETGTDPFGAESAIRYVTYLTVGYLIARGLAKSGSYENRAARDTGPADGTTPRTHADRDADLPDEAELREGDAPVADADAAKGDTELTPSGAAGARDSDRTP
jgi:hypothetical protein